MTNFRLNLLAYSVMLGLTASIAYADEPTQQQLEEINVSGSTEHNDPKTPPKIAETVKTAKKLEKEQAQDVKDLVRYETGITVVEAGRFGNSGFAVRGVEENRVAIQIDGLHQAETISSQGFKELFEGYGNFNNTRNSAEIETLKQVTIRKGADSLKSGSGALGGSVSFDTKDARDYLLNKNYYASYKRGYNTADNQNLQTLTLAGRYKYFDAIAVITSRKGHELENYGYKNYNDKIQGKTREKADPYRRTQDSALLKVGFQPTENHRFSIIADLYKQTSKGHDFSYTLKPNTQYMTYDEKELRHTNDKVERKNIAFVYENFTETPFWDTLKITYSHQKITTTARTDDYCDGNEKCDLVNNKLGLHYNNENKLVDKNNNPVVYNKKDIPKRNYYYVTEEKYRQYYDVGVPKEDADIMGIKPMWGDYVLDPSLNGYACKKKYHKQPGHENECEIGVNSSLSVETLEANGITYDLTDPKNSKLVNKWRDHERHIISCDGINCDKKMISGYKINGESIDIPFTIKKFKGENVAYIDKQLDKQFENDCWNENGCQKNPEKADYLIMPGSIGYRPNLWSQRDLISQTKQLNIDLTKHKVLFNTEHDFSYGGLWSQMKKSMVNISGDQPLDQAWFVDLPETCDTYVNGKLNSDRTHTLCDNKNTFSFLIPVKTKTGALYFIDDFRINDYLAFNLGYRYDRVKYKPEYTPGVTPKIPDDMVTNLYITTPEFDASKADSDLNESLKKEANAAANIKEIAQPKKFSASSYSFGTTLDPLNWLRLQAKYSKGFRAPTSDEIYFTFKHPDFSIRPNRDLQPETAKTKELSLTVHNDMGYITTSVFDTRYQNFIDLSYQGRHDVHGHSKLMPFHFYQNVNRPNAKVTGFEIASQISLGNITKLFNGFSLSYKYTYQKGRINGNIPMNAIQPRTAVYGVSYIHPDDKYGVDLYVSHASAKNAEDTYNMFYKEEGKTDSTIKWRSESYTTIDLLGYIKPIKNLTLRAGVYNLTNRKYITWDSARSIRPFGTSNMINQDTGLGINRFYAPGRNYRMSVQFEF